MFLQTFYGYIFMMYNNKNIFNTIFEKFYKETLDKMTNSATIEQRATAIIML